LEQAELDKALVKAVGYLHQLPDAKFSSYNQRLMLVYISQQYHLPLSPAKNILQQKVLAEEDMPVFQFYQRLIKKHNHLNKKKLLDYFHRSSGIQRIMIWGLYPDLLPLDSQCMLAFETVSGIRNVAHAALALRWSEEKSNAEQKERLKHFYETYAQLFLKEIIKENPAADSGMEGIVGLECLHRKNEINYAWVQSILKHQREDGGWAFYPNHDAESNSHTTLLAIWILAAIRSGE
jgi:hypothetical protein